MQLTPLLAWFFPLRGGRGRAHQYDPLTDDTACAAYLRACPGSWTTRSQWSLSRRVGIALRLEEWDVVRLIHMSEDADAEGHPPSPWGYLVGSFQEIRCRDNHPDRLAVLR
ncbi:MAG: hypothetical protein CM1200mP36_06770 [Gammaproteobacteria bacterium]|nr:MAG: hypothetical protein CM1200mP36_06770 [Gammaproteobacteria bacterium]